MKFDIFLYTGEHTLNSTTENEGLGSAFEALRERATPKTELYKQMQETSDEGRSEEELEQEQLDEMVERAEETETSKQKNTKLGNYLSN